MANKGSSRNLGQNKSKKCEEFLDKILSWSLFDLRNEHLYKLQVEEVPMTFSSTTHYMNSFKYPLLEETRANLLSVLAEISQAPVSLISGLKTIPTSDHKKPLYNYHMTLIGKRSYESRVGDLVALTQVRPKCIDDLGRSNTFFLTAYVTKVIDENPMTVKICSSEDLTEHIEFEKAEHPKGFVVYLTSLTTNMRIWEALNSMANTYIIQRILSSTPTNAKDYGKCCAYEEKDIIDLKVRQAIDSFKLNTSQEAAVFSCISARKCCHQNAGTKLIWGPPGTGKTKTVASILFVSLRTNRRTLTCAPTNIAVVGVVKRLLCMLSDHDLGCDTYGFGDIVLFGNEERMKINADHKELLDVFLDNRINVLGNCLSMWKTYTRDMIRLLENPMKEHRRLIVFKPKNTKTKNKKSMKKNAQKPVDNHKENHTTFQEFAKNRFRTLGKDLIACIRNLYTHLPTSVIPLISAKKMNHSINLIQEVRESVEVIVTKNQCLKDAFDKRVNKSHFMKLRFCKTACLQALYDLRSASFIPNYMSIYTLKKLCLRNASLIFCTASSSIKLYREGTRPIDLVLIDEAAQLKECESTIPLQLPGVRNVVLVGDEKQLPSMVQSEVCEETKFGRSLFERLVLLGHHKHLLDVQYRMHPSISQFPNAEFYDGKIVDGPNVIDKAREKCFLKEDMYGCYSFINVESAKEEFDNNNSTKNMVEVAVIADIVANLFEESISKKQSVTVGCISPYSAQVDAIQTKLGEKYNRQKNGWSFSVNVRSVDGFQGSEEDIIIFSTVRCNHRGSVGFLTSRARANVAITRARHCLWIVGNKETLIKSGSIWKTLVSDAENRGCIFDAHKDKNLGEVMVNALIEFGGYVSLLKTDSILFRDAKWKVNFNKSFLASIAGIRNHNVRKLVVSLLMKLSSGWRQVKKNERTNCHGKQGMLKMFEKYNVNGHLYLLWNVDVVNKNSQCVQVLKFWDILSLSQIQKRARHLESAFGKYTPEMISRCQTKRLERNLVLPMTWPADSAQDPTLVLTSQLGKLSLKKQTKSECS